MPSDTTRGFMIQAKELFDAGKFSAAIMTLRDGLKQYPHFISARVMLGEVYWTSGDVALAQAELEQVIKAVPDNFAAHRKLAMIYREIGQLDAAVRSCRTVLDANPRDLEMRALSAQLQADQVPSPPPPSSEKSTGSLRPVPESSRPVPPQPHSPAVEVARGGPGGHKAASDFDSGSIDTETLAELYIVQGHREQGLSVYRRLAAKDPLNKRYQERIAALQQAALPTAPEGEGVTLVPASLLSEEDLPAGDRRQEQVRRLEGWLQVIGSRRRS